MIRFALLPLYGAFAVISFAILAVKVWALVDVLIRPEHAFPAAGKQTKMLWIGILVGAMLIGFLGLFCSLIGLVAAIVYLVDVRPLVRQYRRRDDGRTNMGPYGPW